MRSTPLICLALFRPLAAPGLCAALLIAPGCSAVKLAGRATATTVSATTTVASVTVRGGGKLAYTAAGTSLDLAAGGVGATAKLAKHGAVVFLDPRTGVVGELPWRHDLTLLAATRLAGLGEAVGIARVVRAGRAMPAAGHHADLSLASGDVIELMPSPALPANPRSR